MRGLPGAVIGTEDCLHLAVHTPELPSADHNPKLPVMVTFDNLPDHEMLKLTEIRRSVVFVQKVYIHGGSFMLGGYIGAGPRKLLERDMVKFSFF